MRKRMLRSVLVAAFSAVAAFGTVAGLSGVQGDAHEVGSEQSVAVVAVDGEAPSYTTNDSKWD
ncbi:hypothetical protein AB0E75_11150 [Streptomyces griseoviridis]|jgi:hypothetical protein|uniref:Uncharacterized protein n=3 Tax=Streptomyces TaxID=1883 RepID=A0A918GRT6_STRGD|nr:MULTISPECIES: hypothetical protein [Streptomyces]MDP9683133.1 hypothetical protein [Streptomyces griseoviridis]GGS56758.1 hypothetical protein GCM10010238_52660 [Streptomyces niveoruber]GGT14265.1 hypothetical protein GCM10010240_54450 [Streptomyces griseoviridis]GGU28569.1 hypothetical protein GCM10010259_18890 [Streptomyces daghestanicus]GHI31952.1 hypothetical protein Sdagh_36820 [Streptomyces daghestanicus]